MSNRLWNHAFSAVTTACLAFNHNLHEKIVITADDADELQLE